MKAKHTHPELISEDLCNQNQNESESVVNESHLDIILKCDHCDFASKNNTDLEIHISEKHNADSETFEIKLEVFCLVENEKNVLETRQNLIDKLNNLKEIESVDKVYVDKNESFIDVNNLQWNSVDIFLKSKQNLKTWQDLSFKRKIFSKCYLWETFEDYYGEKSREHIKRIKEEERASDMRSRGYLV